ncbi:MAG TPA: translocation/assembly module TamB domain-containing protein [Longimicrobiales bacterium]|nr:translocation/assembly module TamB domain-containing protein [Longimicrobiales bacterium]
MSRRRTRPPAALAVLGVVLAAGVAVLLAVWWAARERSVPGPAARREEAAPSPAAAARAPLPVPAARGEIGEFDVRIARVLARDRLSDRPMPEPARVRVTGIDWLESNGSRFFRAREVAGGLDLSAALYRHVVARNVTARDPEVYLSRAAGDTAWNYERVLARLLAPSEAELAASRAGLPPPPKSRVAVLGLTIEHGYAAVRLAERAFEFEGVEGRLPEVRLSGPALPEPLVRVAGGSATLVVPASNVRLPFRVAEAVFRFPENETPFEVGEVAWGESRLVGVRGAYDPRAPGLGITAEGRADPIRLADLKAFSPQIEAEGGGTLTFAVQPTPSAGLRVSVRDLALVSGGSRVTGSLTATVLGTAKPALEAAGLRLEPLELALVERLTGRRLPYGGRITGRVSGRGGDLSFELEAWLTTASVTEPFRVGLTGEALFGPAGPVLRQATAELREAPLAALRAIAPSLPVQGAVSGEIAITGPPTRAPLTLDVRLSAAGGVAIVRGTLDLTGPVAAYDLSGRVLGIDLSRLVQPRLPPASLTAGFQVKGRGFEPATAAATFRAAGRFSGWRTDPDDVLLLRGGIAGGTLTLDTLTAGLASARATAAGRWPFSAAGSGSIRYAVAVTDLNPFAQYLPVGAGVEAKGALAAAGTLGGTLQRPDVRGDFALNGVRAGQWAVAGAGGRFAVVLGDSTPNVLVEGRATGVETPTTVDLRAVEASVALAEPRLAVTLRGDREGGGVIQVAATGSIPPTGERRVQLTQFVADLGGGRWQLQAPAEVAWVPGGRVDVRNLEVRNTRGSGLVSLNGTLAPAEVTSYRLRAEALPIGDLLRLAEVRTPASGLLFADAEVHGPGPTPLVRAQFHVEQGKIQRFDVSALQGELLFQAGRLTASAQATLAEGGRLRLDAALPASLTLGLRPDIRVLGRGPAQGSLEAESLPLAILEPLAPQVEDVTGQLNARMTLSGSADRPVLAGSAVLAGGSVRVPATGQRYTNIAGRLTLRDRRIEVDSVRAQSDGWLVASGAVDFPELNNPTADLGLRFARFRPMAAKGRQGAAVWGELDARGPMRSLTVTGALRLDDGTIVLPASTGQDILTTSLAEAEPAPVMGQATQAVAVAPFGGNVRVSGLRVTCGNDLWFETEEARLQLSGELTVNRAPDGPVAVVGTLTGQRGTFTLTAGPLLVRRLDIARAEIRFFGGEELNPGVDVVATQTVLDAQQRPFDVEVRVTGTLQRPRLALATAEGVQLPESELLSLLVFGTRNTTGSALLPAEQRSALLQQTLFGGLAELASMQLESELLSAGLPLDIFEIRPGFQGGVVAPTVVVGREVTRDVFLTVEYAVGVLFGTEGPTRSLGPTVSLVWRATPQWTATFSRGPVTRGPAYGAFLPAPPTKAQLSVELRRRWTY